MEAHAPLPAVGNDGAHALPDLRCLGGAPPGSIFFAGSADYRSHEAPLLTNQPSVYTRHVATAAALFPHLREDSVVFLVTSTPVYEVLCAIYDLVDGRAEVVAQPKEPLLYGHPNFPVLLASQLVRRMARFRVLTVSQAMRDLAELPGQTTARWPKLPSTALPSSPLTPCSPAVPPLRRRRARKQPLVAGHLSPTARHTRARPSIDKGAFMTAVMPEQTVLPKTMADAAEDPFALDLTVTTDLGGLGMPAACGTGDGCAASCASSCASAV